MDLLAGLTQIGFTEYEAKVYLALLKDNPANGYQLSKSSGVPRSMVYEALGRLVARGAALETIESRATLYTPLPPDILLNRYEEAQLRMMTGLRAGLEDVYQAVDENRVWSIQGRPAVLAYATQMLRSAQVEIFLVLADAELEDLRSEILAADQRGVHLSALLTGEQELGCGRVAYHPPIESELQELTDTMVVVVDEKKALISNPNPLEMNATITSNHNLVLMARQFIWMELFAQRMVTRLGPDLIRQLDLEDQEIFSGLVKEESR